MNTNNPIKYAPHSGTRINDVRHSTRARRLHKANRLPASPIPFLPTCSGLGIPYPRTVEPVTATPFGSYAVHVYFRTWGGPNALYEGCFECHADAQQWIAQHKAWHKRPEHEYDVAGEILPGACGNPAKGTAWYMLASDGIARYKPRTASATRIVSNRPAVQ